MDALYAILPKNFNEYETSLEKRRVCERLLQISVETVLDICNILVSELKLGLPTSEEDVLIKLKGAGVFNNTMFAKLKKMKAFRNILVHRYGIIDDKEIFKILKKDIKDFEEFKMSAIKFLKK